MECLDERTTAWTGGNPGSVAYATKNIKGDTSGYKDFTGLADLVQGWTTGNIEKNGLVLKQVAEATNNVLWFYSSSTATSNNSKRPYLNVNYSDDPDDSWVEPTIPAMTSYGVDAYELEDLQAIAVQESITVQQAVDLYGWQDEFADDVEELATTYPDLYSSAEMNANSGTTPSAKVTFTEAVPSGPAAILNDLPVTVSMDATAAYSEAEMQATVSSANTAIVQAAGASSQVETSFDETDTYIEATVKAPASGRRSPACSRPPRARSPSRNRT